MQFSVQSPNVKTIPGTLWPFSEAPLNATKGRPEVTSKVQLSASSWSLSLTKRVMDFSVALLVLTAAALPMLLIGICVRITSKGPALFAQYRVGRGGKLFKIYKFRSMAVDAGAGPGITKAGDRRVTPLGNILRKSKLDELPQFYNMLAGDMSLVGPRPKTPRYEVMMEMPFRPGITGAATLAFRNEEEILRTIPTGEIDHFYAMHIKPLKAQIDAMYMSEATLRSDLGILLATFFACFTSSKQAGQGFAAEQASKSA